MNNKHLDFIHVKGARTHNLKSIDVSIPKNQFIVFCGPSGSGKSSLAYDTVFIEGQRLYIESFLAHSHNPNIAPIAPADVDSIDNLSPSIATEQKTVSKSKRSTVGTVTNINHYLQVLFARGASLYCPQTGCRISKQTASQIVESIQKLVSSHECLQLFSPQVKGKTGSLTEDILILARKGFTKARIDGVTDYLTSQRTLHPSIKHTLEVYIDAFTPNTPKEQIAESVLKALEIGNGVCILVDTSGHEHYFSTHYFSDTSKMSFKELEPSDFSFNSIEGMCKTCEGIGKITRCDVSKIIQPELSIIDGCCLISPSPNTFPLKHIYESLKNKYQLNLYAPWKSIAPQAQHAFLYGCENLEVSFTHPISNRKWKEVIHWEGILDLASQKYHTYKTAKQRKKYVGMFEEITCPSCQGSRLKEYPSAAKLDNKTFLDICSLNIRDACLFFEQLSIPGQIGEALDKIITEIHSRIKFIQQIGLEYLSLGRPADSLSGGESQRVRLASQIGSGLVGITYIFDEPSVGLHPQDVKKLIQAFKSLKHNQNTVIVVEHDPSIIMSADHIIEFGPKGGSMGGEIVFQGSKNELISANTLTALSLSKNSQCIPVRKPNISTGLTIKNINIRHIKNLDLKIPVGGLVVIAGVSGSGKSTLVHDVIVPTISSILEGRETQFKSQTSDDFKNITKIIEIDQKPIGRLSRSNASTYTKIFDEIRELFCSLPESKSQGFSKGRFSFNVKDGSCKECQGLGFIEVDMAFMAPEAIMCHRCGGKCFDENTLSIKYKHKNIAEILDLTVSEAIVFFDAFPKITNTLQIMEKLFLGYLKLGMPSPSLSGGEAQRIKLAKEISKGTNKKSFYTLDEPTTGLHSNDIQSLITLLRQIIDKDNTVLLIEHNLDVIKQADWIIELGPQGGELGGQIIAQGKAEDLIMLKTPTGIALSDNICEPSTINFPNPSNFIEVKNVKQNNLKSISTKIKHNNITACCGPSGSGKSSFAFDTIYAEGQRRFVDSLSPYLRQFIKHMPKPKLESISNIPAAISIEHKQLDSNPRSTLGTCTEIYNILRILYSRLGQPFCPNTGEKIQFIRPDDIINELNKLPHGIKIQVISPIKVDEHISLQQAVNNYINMGFGYIVIDGQCFDLMDDMLKDIATFSSAYIVIDRLKSQQTSKDRWLSAIERSTQMTKNIFSVLLEDGSYKTFNLNLCVPTNGATFSPITTKTFSFNHKNGQCECCKGLGVIDGVIPQDKLPSKNTSVIGWICSVSGPFDSKQLEKIKSLLYLMGINPQESFKDLSDSQVSCLIYGSKDSVKIHRGYLKWNGLITTLKNLNVFQSKTMTKITCPLCEGSRLCPIARHVLIDDISIDQLCKYDITNTLQFVKEIKDKYASTTSLKILFVKAINILSCLQDLGLNHLSLDRSMNTLSFGEAQRVKIASQICSGLSNILYILDEPSTGLHAHDCHNLSNCLKKLQSINNTILLVDHSPKLLLLADHILEFGPRAGSLGGEIILQGPAEEVFKNKSSLTGKFIYKHTETNSKKTLGTFLTFKNQSSRNIHNVDISIPSNAITCIIGVSGSGKSTLLKEIIYKNVCKKYTEKNTCFIDQCIVNFGSRSDISSYCDIGDKIRENIAFSTQAKALGLTASHFNPNSNLGMCKNCLGHGYISINLKFMANAKIVCEVCQGAKLHPLALKVSYKGINIQQIMNLRIDEALEFFSQNNSITHKLTEIQKVGLGYLQLGQELNSLSLGEVQRLTLAHKICSVTRQKKTMYLFDEPSLGLHPYDAQLLVNVFNRLIDNSSTVICVDHNQEIVDSAHWIIEMGEGGGHNGGKILFQGPKEEFIKSC